ELNANSQHIALVSEWDTLYGRILPGIITGCLLDVKCKQQKQITTSRQDLDWPWVHSYSYLRGLDGKLPRRKEAKASDSTEDRADAQAADRSTAPSGQEVNKNPERADGQGQLDYLRRLAGLVRTQDQERQQLGQGGIAAIGILGSDVYDKLLILQALRPEFPDALFFTTDLDALLFPQGKQRQTRNLLVASSFGLSLREERQGNIPPFRSTYQSSIFLATQLAIRNNLNVSPQNINDTRNKIDKWLETPRLFEIGRTGAYSLPVSPEQGAKDPQRQGQDPPDQAKCRNDILDCDFIQPHPAKLFPQIEIGLLPHVSIVFIVAMVTMSVAMCFWFASVPYGQGQSSSSLPSPSLARLLTIVAIVLALALV